MPGQPGNLNRLIHGRRSKRTGLVIVEMARQHRGIAGYCHLMRRQLESQARQAHKIGAGEELPAWIDTGIGTAIDAERVRRKAQQLARAKADAGNLETSLELERTALEASKQRTAAILRLGLEDQTPTVQSALDRLYSTTEPIPRPSGNGDGQEPTSETTAPEGEGGPI